MKTALKLLIIAASFIFFQAWFSSPAEAAITVKCDITKSGNSYNIKAYGSGRIRSRGNSVDTVLMAIKSNSPHNLGSIPFGAYYGTNNYWSVIGQGGSQLDFPYGFYLNNLLLADFSVNWTPPTAEKYDLYCFTGLYAYWGLFLDGYCNQVQGFGSSCGPNSSITVNNCPAYQACPVSCGYGGGNLADGNCSTHYCAATAACCTPESNAAFCSRYGKNCNNFRATDNCGSSRTVNCGSCSSPNTCGGGGTANVCGCTAVCSGKPCGSNNGCGGTCSSGSGCCSTVNITGSLIFTPSSSQSTTVTAAYGSSTYQDTNAKTARDPDYSVSVPVTNPGYTISASSSVGNPPNKYNLTQTTGTNPVTIGTTCNPLTGPTFTYDLYCTGDLRCDPWSACTNGTQTRTCTDQSCGNTISQSRSCTNAGMVRSGTSMLESGGGNVSQGGADSQGWRQNLYTDSAAIANADYDYLEHTVFTRAGVTAEKIMDGTPLCASTNPDAYTVGNYDFYCYSETKFAEKLNKAIGDSNSRIKILYPEDANQVNPYTDRAITTLSANDKKIIVFVKTNLDIRHNISITGNSGIIFSIGGNLKVASDVDKLDGVYLFGGEFNDGESSTQLTGRGSLLAVGTPLPGGQTIYFQRIVNNAPSELWTYEPKYFNLFQSLLAIPSYPWMELPPE